MVDNVYSTLSQVPSLRLFSAYLETPGFKPGIINSKPIPQLSASGEDLLQLGESPKYTLCDSVGHHIPDDTDQINTLEGPGSKLVVHPGASLLPVKVLGRDGLSQLPGMATQGLT